MKTRNLYFAVIALFVSLLFGCENKLEMYNHDNGLNFILKAQSDTLVNFSFVYGPSATIVDTVWFTVQTMGFVTKEDREIALEQLAVESNGAKAGVHYVAFDDPSLQKYYVIKGGAIEASIPVVVKRDASIKTQPVTLLFTFKDNGQFKPALKHKSRIRLVISDQLAKPANWAWAANYYLGQYGPVKHQFLIEQTGKRWDYDYLWNELGFTTGMIQYGVPRPTNEFFDRDYIMYYRQVLKDKLSALNAQRASQGLDVLKEADNTEVKF